MLTKTSRVDSVNYLKPTTKFLVLFQKYCDVFINLSLSSFNHLICVKQQDASVECHSSLLSFSEFVLKPIYKSDRAYDLDQNDVGCVRMLDRSTQMGPHL